MQKKSSSPDRRSKFLRNLKRALSLPPFFIAWTIAEIISIFGLMVKHILMITGMSLMLAACGSNAGKDGVPAERDGIRTMVLDGVTATWISDRAGEHRLTASLLEGADSLLTLAMRENGISSSMSVYWVESEGTGILFDTGIGGDGACMIARLDSIGVAPADVKYLYLTHMHGDHIGGMLHEGEVVFPNAEVYLAREERDAWLAMPEDRNRQAVQTLEAYASQLHLFEFGETLPGNVLAIDATGHTPGHTAFQIGKLLIVGDLVHGASVQLKHTEVSSGYDMDKEKAVEARVRLLQYAADNGLTIAGMHLQEDPSAPFGELPYAVFPLD